MVRLRRSRSSTGTGGSGCVRGGRQAPFVCIGILRTGPTGTCV